jgi:glycosyltransferase involved in cell wall biosynthesis
MTTTRRGVRTLLTRSISTLLTVATTANALAAAYLAVLTVAGARRPRAMAASTRQTCFAVMIPAHDEAAVIADALQALRDLDYPSDRFDVHVVADNCTDATADIVRSFGWTVHERRARDDPGKGPALNWLFERIDDGRYDAAVIVDADSVVDRGFLDAMDRAFSDGARAAQGFYSVLDPEVSPSAGVRFIALACRHHLRPLGRCRLGGSAGLYGNGMAFEWQILRRRPWTGHLVEDAEFQLEMLLDDDIVVAYVPHARLVAEMPSTLQGSTSQNARWERGRLELVTHYTPRLARDLLRGGVRRRIARADAIADLVLPPLSVLAAAQVLTTALNIGVALSGSSRARTRVLIDVGGVLAVTAHVLTALRAVDAPRSAYRSLARVPRMVVWKVRLWLAVLKPSADVDWQRTQRNADQSADRPAITRSSS